MKIDPTPDFLESVANHPRVLPYISVKGVDVIKFAPIWHDCIAVVFDTGGWLFHRQADPDVYEVHTLFLPKSEGVVDRPLNVRQSRSGASDATEVCSTSSYRILS